jgi:23S rRNA (uracil1939-C5)-methyltransferase
MTIAKQRKKLSKNFNPQTLIVQNIGARGEGISNKFTEMNFIEKEYNFFIPFALPTEKIIVKPYYISSEGIRANIIEVIEPSSERIEAKCKHFFKCGGCILQHWDFQHYSKWKSNKVKNPIKLISSKTVIKEINTSPLNSRRHAKFVAKKTKSGVIIGFNEYRSNFISEIDDCIILDKKLIELVKNLNPYLNEILKIGQIINIHVNLLDFGIDMMIEGIENIPYSSLLPFTEKLIKKNIVRLTRKLKDNTNDLLFINDKTNLSNLSGTSYMLPPPGSFLQATRNGEMAILESITNGLKGLPQKLHICELFSGSGSITIPLLERGYKVDAYEINSDAINAIDIATKKQNLANKVKVYTRNLKTNPLSSFELQLFDVIIIDPPRSGAQSQFVNIAKSQVPLVISISCNINSFIKDAKILFESNYELKWVKPIDQFLFTQHIELVGLFELR